VHGRRRGRGAGGAHSRRGRSGARRRRYGLGGSHNGDRRRRRRRDQNQRAHRSRCRRQCRRRCGALLEGRDPRRAIRLVADADFPDERRACPGKLAPGPVRARASSRTRDPLTQADERLRPTLVLRATSMSRSYVAPPTPGPRLIFVLFMQPVTAECQSLYVVYIDLFNILLESVSV
jgi:hypothetical protein